MLIFSGSLKTNGLVPALPVDLSVALAALVVAFSAASVISFGAPHRNVYFIPVLWVVLLLSLIPYAGDSDYIATKTINLLTITLVIALAPFFVLRNERQRWWFLVGIVAVALLTVAGALLIPAADSARFLPEGSNPIDFGRTVGSGALVLIFAALSRAQMHRTIRILALVVGAILLVGMLAAGSRGPSFGVLVALFAVFIAAPEFRRQRTRGMVVTGVLIAAGAWWLATNGQGGFERITESLVGGGGDVTSGRESLWATATRLIEENPLGVGLGGFSQVGHSPYPHNLVLEIFAEFGWLTGVLLVALAAVSLIRLARRATTPILAIMFGLAVLAVVAAIFSSDFNGNRLMWVTLAFAWTIDSPAGQRARS